MIDRKSFVRSDIFALIFTVAEIAMFPLIQLTSGGVSSFWSYLSIISVAVMAFYTFKSGGADHFIRAGLVFTLIADYFLVIDGEKQLEGVIAFICVQMMYFAYLFVSEENRRVRIANALVRVALSTLLVVVAFLVLGEDTDALAIASVLYYANLVINAAFAFVLGRGERVFAVGLVLFAMCDLCIGLEVLFDSYLKSDIMDFFYGKHLNLPWVFYQPSQVLIGLHLYLRYRKSVTNK